MDVPTRLLERQEIIDTITTLFVATDQRDWAAVEESLAPEVLFDMSSLTRAAPATLSREAIVAGWRRGLAPIQAVHHQAGNFRVAVDGDSARAFCYGIAFHYRPNRSGQNTRTFVGSYDFHLARSDGRWRIDQFRFHCKFVDGNLDLEKL